MRFSWLHAVLLASSLAMPAYAFPWMVKHNYGSCAACHVDPSGSGQLSAYGRAQSFNLLRFRTDKPKEEEEVPRSANFLWFLELPDAVNLSGNVRGGALVRPGAATGKLVPQLMATELYATINIDRFVFHGSGGFGIRNYVAPAIVAPACDHAKLPPEAQGQCGASFVSREHWLGAKFADEAVMVRAGRMFLPFGMRNNEHYLFVRDLTKTDVNVGQQLGVAVSYNSETLRGEVMGILGNFLIGPDAYRERGYAAFAEYALQPNAYIGLSSLITSARAGLTTGQPTTRHAHGLFARWAPSDTLAFLGELDFLAWQTPNLIDRVGFATYVQADYELFQGLHFMGTLEGAHTGSGEMGPWLGLWLSAAMYALPHLELRLDNILRRRSQAGGPGSVEFSMLLMLHVFL